MSCMSCMSCMSPAAASCAAAGGAIVAAKVVMARAAAAAGREGARRRAALILGTCFIELASGPPPLGADGAASGDEAHAWGEPRRVGDAAGQMLQARGR